MRWPMESELLRRVLERGVLFDGFEIPYVERISQDPFIGNTGRTVMAPDRLVPPTEIRVFCRNPKCEDTMDWVLVDEGKECIVTNLGEGYSALEYRCRHTPYDKVVFFYRP